MKYELKPNKILIYGKEDFNPQHILECGQIFAYDKTDNGYEVLSKDCRAAIKETEFGYEIITKNTKYFEHFFDLKTDYGKIKKTLSKYDIMKRPVEFGYGIRILKNDLFETVVSFIISANNNIKRIQLILGRLREKLGEKKDGFYAFPTREKLLSVGEDFFARIGAGYRAKYLYNVVRQVDEETLLAWQELETGELRRKLIALSGVGPKVADCILLFGYGRGDVFPVDTWMAKMYNKFYDAEQNRERIRFNLTKEFGLLSGFAQQYLFYYMRSGEE